MSAELGRLGKENTAGPCVKIMNLEYLNMGKNYNWLRNCEVQKKGRTPRRYIMYVYVYLSMQICSYICMYYVCTYV